MSGEHALGQVEEDSEREEEEGDREDLDELGGVDRYGGLARSELDIVIENEERPKHQAHKLQRRVESASHESERERERKRERMREKEKEKRRSKGETDAC